MSKIRIAIVGVGNCVNAMVQALYRYKGSEGINVPGLLNLGLEGYRIDDIEPVVAFDVDERKVGKDLSEAIFVPPNCAWEFADVPKLGVEVLMGKVEDGVPNFLKKHVKVAKREPVDVEAILKEKKVDIMVNTLPTGSTQATRFYADIAIKKAKIGFINGIPEMIANSEEYAKAAQANKIPIVGDDIKNQLGATTLHKALAKLCFETGIKITETYQVNCCGNTDFVALSNRGESKVMTKTKAVTNLIPYEFGMSTGLTYLDILKDKKIAFIMFDGKSFGDAPFKIEAKIEVEDSPHAAAKLIDSIRCCKMAMDRGIGGVLHSVSACFMKYPPKKMDEEVAKKILKDFIEGKTEENI